MDVGTAGDRAVVATAAATGIDQTWVLVAQEVLDTEGSAEHRMLLHSCMVVDLEFAAHAVGLRTLSPLEGLACGV